MISNLTISNFKIHKHLVMPMSNLTILAGLNGSGKSSVIQALALLRQSKDSLSADGLTLNGQLFNGTNAGTLENWESGSDLMEINFEVDDRTTYPFEFKYVNIEDTEIKRAPDSVLTEGWKELPLYTKDFQYISAFRLGPNDDYSTDSGLVEKGQISKFQGRCEYAVSFLFQNASKNIGDKRMCHESDSSLLLGDQVNAWMQEISPEVRVVVERSGDKYKLNYRYQDHTASAVNSGFGLTYALPIVIAVLNARPGALILIENPEAHIHGAGQAALMRLVAMAAACGIQIVIETHSDHILDGALVAVKQGIMKKEQLAVKFFDIEDDHTSHCYDLKVESNGRIMDVPEGFFDQFSKDLEILTRPAKR